MLKKCNNLVIAITVVGKMRAYIVDSWHEILSLFDEHELEEFEYEENNLFQCLHVSVQTLTEGEKKRYYMLSVFPEDVGIPVEVLQFLWMMQVITQNHPQEIEAYLKDKRFVSRCTRNSNRFFLKMVKLNLVISRSKGKIFLHDLQLEYVKAYCKHYIQDLQLQVLNAVWEQSMETSYFKEHQASWIVCPYLKTGPYREYICFVIRYRHCKS